MNTTGFGSWIAARSNPYVSAGVDGMTTLSPGMCASSASRLCECWLPDERPAPNWVRTVSAICAAPPVMNGSFAAWLSSWSRHTPRKSRYISSTTGRMPAIAAPTPRPTIALSEMGVSRTRSPNRSCRPRVRPNTLPPAATSIPATNTRSSPASSASSAARIASMVRNTGASAAGAGGSGRSGLGRVDEVGQRGGRRRRQPPSCLDGFVELVRDRGLHGFERVVRDARRAEPARADEQRVACFPLADLVGRSVALRVAFVVTVPAVGGRLDDDGTASGARRLDHRAHRGRGRHDVVAVDRDVVDAVAGGAPLE